MYRSILALTFVMLVSGCASMNENECLLGDWYAVGFEDGAAGHAEGRVARHRKACAKHGIPVSLTDYREGWAAGRRNWCQPPNGFHQGARGAAHAGACPPDLEPAFAAAWQDGRRLHDLESGVSATTREIHARAAEIEDIDEAVREKEERILARETEASERVLLLADIGKLASRRGKLESEIEALEHQRVLREAELSAYRESLDPRYR